MMISRGVGEILYESADIAFDTVRGMFFNPKTKVDYGTKPPAGGWEIPWYGTPSGEVIVVTGDAGVAKTQAQATALKATVTQQLAAQAAKDPTNYGVYAAAAARTAATGTTPAVQASQASSFTMSPWFKEEMVSGVPNWVLAVAAAVAAYWFSKQQ